MVTLECLQEITIFTLYLKDKRGQFTFPFYHLLNHLPAHHLLIVSDFAFEMLSK